MDLFDAASADRSGVPAAGPGSPLAVRMRPRALDEVLGQDHLLSKGSPLRRLLASADDSAIAPASVILHGPAGTGKTTLAYLVARESDRAFVELSAVSAGVNQVREVIAAARRALATSGRETVLFIDEIHRFTKSQQDALLPAVENRWVTLVGATTENPSFSVITPLLSRSLLLTLNPLDDDEISALLDRALFDERGLAGRASLDDEARTAVVRMSGGDARRALTILEAASGAAENGDGARIGVSEVAAAVAAASVVYDRSGDQHYDVVSAFIKSVRGSDVDAALHYLARMVEAGEDPRFIARRLIILSAEDIGMADPAALPLAVAAAQAVQLIGMPEGRIPLAEAVVYLATAPKSNAAYLGVEAAIADIRAGLGGVVPPHLRDAHYPGAARLGSGEGYLYAHDAPHAVAAQQHAPDDLAGRRYYTPTSRGCERDLQPRLDRIRQLLHITPPPEQPQP